MLLTCLLPSHRLNLDQDSLFINWHYDGKPSKSDIGFIIRYTQKHYAKHNTNIHNSRLTNIKIQINTFSLHICNVVCVDNVVFIITGSGLGEPSSNSNLVCWVHFCANVLRKGMNPSFPWAMCLNRCLNWIP